METAKTISEPVAKVQKFIHTCRCVAFASFFPSIYLIGNLAKEIL